MVDKQLTADDLFSGFCCGDSDIVCRINENGTQVFKTTIRRKGPVLILYNLLGPERISFVIEDTLKLLKQESWVVSFEDIDPIRGVPLIAELKTLRKGPLTVGVFSNSSFGTEVGVGYIATNGYSLNLESDAASDLLIRIIAECNPCRNDEVLQKVQSDCAANCWFDDVNAT